MNIINYYLEQESGNTSIYDESLMKEYFNLCRFLHNQEITNSEIIDIMKANLANLDKNETKLILELAGKLENELKSIIPKLKEKFPSVEIEGFVFLIGEGNIDGHGLLVEGKAYVVLDLLTLINSIDYYNLEILLYHEIIHAIHYYLSPNMYLANYNSIEDKYYKRIVAEGIATYVSGRCMDTKSEDFYWLGFFDENQTMSWKSKCKRKHDHISKKLKESINDKQINDDIYYGLFSVDDPSDLESSRLAYYYGAEICSNYIKDKSLEELLKTKEYEWKQVVSEYFMHACI